MSRRLSMRSAIDAMCKRCIYDPLDNGTWREQVRRCTSATCPLFPLRPLPIGQKRADSASEAETPEDAAANAGGSLFDLDGSKTDR